MGTFDFFEHEHGKKHHHSTYHYEHDRHEDFSPGRQHGPDIRMLLLEKLKSNPRARKIMLLLIVGGLVVLVLLLILLFPLLNRLLQFVSENGIQSVIDAIWTGSKQ
jgi:hypothetical protein